MGNVPRRKTQMTKEINFDETGSESELSLEDLKGNFIKNPAVGENITLNIKKVVKKTAETIVLKDGTKFKKTLSGDGIDYYYKIHTAEDKTYDITSWEVFKKLSEIFNKVGRTKNLTVKLSHIKDGTNKKDKGDNYKVELILN